MVTYDYWEGGSSVCDILANRAGESLREMWRIQESEGIEVGVGFSIQGIEVSLSEIKSGEKDHHDIDITKEAMMELPDQKIYDHFGHIHTHPSEGYQFNMAFSPGDFASHLYYLDKLHEYNTMGVITKYNSRLALFTLTTSDGFDLGKAQKDVLSYQDKIDDPSFDTIAQIMEMSDKMMDYSESCSVFLD